MFCIVVPHDVAWAAAFAAEAQRLRVALGPTLLSLHHIGSTAIPGMPAKPIIDILAEVPELDAIDAARWQVQALGYEVLGAYGIETRRYFRKLTADGLRTHHLHAFASGSPHLIRHLAFRDYLVAHREAANDYAALKTRLLSQPGATCDSYLAGKAPFMAEMEKEALAWWRSPKVREITHPTSDEG